MLDSFYFFVSSGVIPFINFINRAPSHHAQQGLRLEVHHLVLLVILTVYRQVSSK